MKTKEELRDVYLKFVCKKGDCGGCGECENFINMLMYRGVQLELPFRAGR
jgi:hypothetical protein